LGLRKKILLDSPTRLQTREFNQFYQVHSESTEFGLKASLLPSQLVQGNWKRKLERVNLLTLEFDNHVNIVAW